MRARRPAVSRLALGWIATGLLLAGGILSLYLVQVSSVAMAGYDLERLEVERQTWLARNQQLEVELAKRRSLAWSELQATQQLGMTKSERPIFLQVKSGGDELEQISSSGEMAAPPRRGQGVHPSHPPSASPFDALRAWFVTVPAQRR
jgi:hypothetical protein